MFNTLLRAAVLLIAVGLASLGAHAQQVTPIEAEEQGIILSTATTASAAQASSGLSLRTLGDVLLIPRGGLPGSDQSLMVLDADTGDLIDANFIVFTEHTAAPIQAILNFEGDGIFISTQANTTGNVVYQYDLDGNFLGVFAPAGGANTSVLQNIRGISLDPTGTRLWVTVASGANFSSIAEFDTGGNYLGNFAGWPDSPVGHPWSILVRESDVLISSGGYPHSIHRFEFDGTYLGVWNQHPLYSPQQLALAANGNVLNSAFQTQGAVYEFTPDGLLMAQYTPLANLRGVHELANGNLLVTNSDGVHEVTRQNEFVRTIVTGDARHITAIRQSNLSFMPRTLQGEVIEGTTAQDSFTMQNNTAEPLNFAFTELPAFITGISPASGLLPADGSVEVSVTFDGAAAPVGSHLGTITVQTDESENNVYTYHVVLTVNGISGCAIEPDPIVFGEVVVGFDEMTEVSVTNQGTAPCTLTNAVTDTDDFFATGFPWPISLSPGETIPFYVTFAPSAAGPITGTLTLPSSDGDVTAALAGTGVAAAEAMIEPAQLNFNVVAGSSASTSMSLSNLAEAGSADLEFSVLVTTSQATGQLVSPPPARVPPVVRGTGPSIAAANPGPYIELTGGPITYQTGFNAVTITHSADTAIPYSPSPVGCSNWFAMYARPNQYWRVFDLSQFGIDEELTVTSVDVGVWMAHSTNPPLTTVRLHTLDGELHTSNLTLVAETELQITAAHNLQLATADFPDGVTFSPSDVLVVEWAIPDGEPGLIYEGHHTLAGQNSAGETGPTYFSAQACGWPEPTPLSQGGFPDRHWVLLVHGTSGPALVTIDPQTGTVPAGTSQELIVTVDSEGFEEGTYEFEILIETNDPVNPVLVVNVEVVIGDTQAPPQAHAAPLSLEFEVNASTNPSSWQMLSVSNLAGIGSADLNYEMSARATGFGPGRSAAPGMLTLDPHTGIVPGGQTAEIMVTASCDENDEPGTHSFELLVQTNDPDNPVLVVHVDVIVTGAVGNEGEGQPFVFALEPNRPNPASGITVIGFELAEATAVRIEVYDLSGRRVATLVDAEMEAGRHSATWDASRLAAGVYLYRMQAGAFTATNRAVIVR